MLELVDALTQAIHAPSVLCLPEILNKFGLVLILTQAIHAPSMLCLPVKFTDNFFMAQNGQPRLYVYMYRTLFMLPVPVKIQGIISSYLD
jgi:hypothetical protein